MNGYKRGMYIMCYKPGAFFCFTLVCFDVEHPVRNEEDTHTVRATTTNSVVKIRSNYFLKNSSQNPTSLCKVMGPQVVCDSFGIHKTSRL